MNCKDIQNNLIAYGEGELIPEMRTAMTGHIENCESCSRLVEGFMQIESAIEAEKAKEPNPFLATRILQNLEYNPGMKNRVRVLALSQAVFPLLILAALLIGFFIGNHSISRTLAEPNPIEVLKSDFYVHDFVDEDITVLTNK